MSAAPFLQPRPASPRARRPSPAVRPADRRQAVRRARVSPWPLVSAAVATFVVVAFASFLVSTLLGHSLVEVARRETVDAQRRTSHAREDLVRLRERVDRLTSIKAIDGWAAERGYDPPGGLLAVATESSADAKRAAR